MREEHQSGGLHAPGAVLGSLERPSRWSPLRIALQLVGFGVSVGLLVWVVMLVLSEENQERLGELAQPSGWLIGALVLTTVGSIIVNAMIFLVLSRPLRRLSAPALVAVNSIATFLSILPFKLGLAVRVVIHHRRDRMPFREIVPWLASVAAVTLAVLLPLAGVSVWRGAADGLWWAGSAVGVGACCAAGVWLSGMAERARVLAMASLGSYVILRRWRVVAAAAALRLVDVGLLAARFGIASRVAGFEMGADQAVLLASVYFMIGVMAPTGATGFQLGGAVALAALQQIDAATMGLIALIVTCTEIGTSAVMGGIGALGLWRGGLFRCDEADG